MSERESVTAEKEFYRVEAASGVSSACACPACTYWTIVYDDGAPTEIGTSWQGEDGREMAGDICDLMNMAFDAGRAADDAKITPLSMCSTHGILPAFPGDTCGLCKEEEGK